MNLSLNPEKIKNITYLTNRILEKEESFNTPKHCFFLGSGCSVTSDIPTGYGVMNICRKVSFIQNHDEGYKFGKINHDFINFLNDVESFVSNHQHEYETYVNNKEKEFKSRLEKLKIVNRIPNELKTHIASISGLNKEELETKLYDDFIDQFHNDSLYGFWFEEYSQDTRERQKLIENIIENKSPGGEYILFANIIDQGLINNIFTTNFDDLLNEALISFTNKKARVFSHNESAQYISIGSKKPNIIKLHGDYLYENIKNLNDETGELETNMKAKFSEALHILDMVVIGYSGSDYSIMSVLESIKKNRTFGLFWCGRNPEKLHWRVINLINNTKNSFFIQVDDFETLVFKIWGVSNNIVKSLIQDATEKQNQLENFLNKYKRSIDNNISITPQEKETFDKGLKANEFFNLAFNVKDPHKQIELYSKSLLLNPNYSDSYNNRGVAYQNLKKYKEALIDYNKAIEINPNNFWYFANRSKALALLEDTDAAFDDINTAFMMEPNDSYNYDALGTIYLTIKKYPLAIENYTKSLSLDSMSPNVFFNRGHAYEEVGEHNLALEDYNKALELGYKDLDLLYNNIAVIYRRLRQFEKAEDFIKKALEINPNLGNTYGTLALIYSDMDQDSAFYKNLELALQKGCPVWNYLDDPSLNKYAHEKRFQELLKQYQS